MVSLRMLRANMLALITAWSLVVVPRVDGQLGLDGSEFLVNTTTTSDQQRPDVCYNPASESFMVVWDGNGPGDSDGIFARRYALQGSPFGPEFRVNSTVVDYDSYPAVTCRAQGGQSVAVWSSFSPLFGPGRFRGQRFDSAGTPLGTEFDTGSVGYFLPGPPDVCDNEDGEFVVVWVDFNNVKAQRYFSTGTPMGSTIVVNQNPTGGDGQPYPKVCCGYRRNGNFVVAWNEINYPNPGNHRVKAARFDLTTGTKLDSGVNEISVSNFMDPFIEPDISCSDDGKFVVVWDTGNLRVRGQRYDSGGDAVGGTFDVTSFGDSYMPTVSSDFFGDFIVAWRDEVYGGDVVVQKYTSAGATSGGAILLNETSAGGLLPFLHAPAVAATANDKVVVAWDSGIKDGSGGGIVARRLGCL
jgi:hypothetical protein